jgi:hypothetical protein
MIERIQTIFDISKYVPKRSGKEKVERKHLLMQNDMY